MVAEVLFKALTISTYTETLRRKVKISRKERLSRPGSQCGMRSDDGADKRQGDAASRVSQLVGLQTVASRAVPRGREHLPRVHSPSCCIFLSLLELRQSPCHLSPPCGHSLPGYLRLESSLTQVGVDELTVGGWAGAPFSSCSGALLSPTFKGARCISKETELILRGLH